MAQTGRTPRRAISLDWMLLTVGAIAMLLLVGTMVRVAGEDDPSQRVGDLFAIQDDEALLAFQDFTFGAPGWTPGETSDRLPGLGPVLGPFTDEAVRRRFALPVNTAEVHVMFDLHMLGDWSARDRVRVFFGATEVLALRSPGVAAPAVEVLTGPDEGVRVLTEQRDVTPQAPDAALPGPVEPFFTHSVQIRIADPGEALVLRLMAQPEGQAMWTLDNLTVVATSGVGR